MAIEGIFDALVWSLAALGFQLWQHSQLHFFKALNESALLNAYPLVNLYMHTRADSTNTYYVTSRIQRRLLSSHSFLSSVPHSWRLEPVLWGILFIIPVQCAVSCPGYGLGALLRVINSESKPLPQVDFQVHSHQFSCQKRVQDRYIQIRRERIRPRF